jgi:hypothetical protein
MRLECPVCHKPVYTSDFKIIPGTGGGFDCPECKQMIHYSQPHAVFRRTLALGLSVILLMMFGVHKVLWLLGGALLLWAPMQVLVNAYCVRAMPLGLKPWVPRSTQGKTPLWEPHVPQLFTQKSNKSSHSNNRES